MKTNLVTTVRVHNIHFPLDRINMLCKDINSHEHCNVEAHSVLGETDKFEIKVSRDLCCQSTEIVIDNNN